MRSNTFLGSLFDSTPHVIKNLIIINSLMLLASFAFERFMVGHFALFYPESPLFRPYQLLTHMFMHGDFVHLFFNMYALWVFGRVLEKTWGGKRFLFYYLATGLGAVCLHLFVLWIQMQHIESNMEVGLLANLKNTLTMREAIDMRDLNSYFVRAPEWSNMLLTPTLGASGAVFGVLLAFGMMFPDTELQLLFPPIVLKAKWFVLIYGGIELVLGFSYATSNIAHFAHVGGMLFGFLIIKYWQKKGILYRAK